MIVYEELNKITYNITKKYIVSPKEIKNIIFHLFETNTSLIGNLNNYAQNSLKQLNEANKISYDEAISIHIITSILNTKMRIIYEKQIHGFFGKPDFILKLGKKMYILVSTTRAISKRKIDKIEKRKIDKVEKRKIDKVEKINKRNGKHKHNYKDIFDTKIAKKLIYKKINKLVVCLDNIEYMVNDLLLENSIIIPILHILAPNKKNAELCREAYFTYVKNGSYKDREIYKKIKVIISLVNEDYIY